MNNLISLLISTMTFLDENISIKDMHFTLYNLRYQTWWIKFLCIVGLQIRQAFGKSKFQIHILVFHLNLYFHNDFVEC
jgi:hypothetical protein